MIYRSTYLPTVRLAVGGGKARQDRCFIPQPEHIGQAPALLVSYYYFDTEFRNAYQQWHFRDWVLDSGAFSAHNSGATIHLDEYIEFCQQSLIDHAKLSEIFALDVIGDWRESVHNTERMWAAGIEAIPTYHYGEPTDLLVSLCRDYPKVALGGAVGLAMPTKLAWAKQCFSRTWPCKLHGFGFASEQYIMQLPFHSVDSSTWMFAAASFNRHDHFGPTSAVFKYKRRNEGGETPKEFRPAVEHYLKIERRASARWRKQFQEMGWVTPDPVDDLVLDSEGAHDVQ